MSEFRKLQTQHLAKSTVHESAEEKYWKRFKPAAQCGAAASALTFSAPVTGVAFSPAAGFEFAVTSSTRVCIYDGKTVRLKRTLARFKDIAYGASYRHDGRLIAAGCKNNHVYVFDADKGSLMRMLKGHKGAVQATAGGATGSFVLSCSDDQTVRYWDVSTEEQLHSFRGHTDQVRSCSGLVGEAGEQLWATGSFDHTVKLWDVRVPSASGPVLDLKLDGPVEAVLAQPGAAPRILAAAGNAVKVFDLKSGGRLVHEMSDHQKTITSLFSDGTGTRVLSGSLDGMLKVTDSATFECTATIVVGSGQGILSAGISRNNGTLVVGCVSGQALIKKRQQGPAPGEGDDAESTASGPKAPRGIFEGEPRAGTRRFFMRGGSTAPAPGDFQVAIKKHKRLAAYDVQLRKFNYKGALDDVLKSRQPVLVAGLLEELQLRNGLAAALSSRDDTALEPLLSFLVKYVTNPRFSDVLVDVCQVTLELYASELGQSVLIDELFVKLQGQLRSEVKLQKELMKLSGTIDMLLAATTV